MELSQKKCIPCEGGIPKLAPEHIATLMPKLSGWQLEQGRLVKQVKFKDFVQLMAFVNRMAEVAEAEGHHPDFSVHYNQLDVTVWTHAVDGLTENDFILAAKLDALEPPKRTD